MWNINKLLFIINILFLYILVETTHYSSNWHLLTVKVKVYPVMSTLRLVWARVHQHQGVLDNSFFNFVDLWSSGFPALLFLRVFSKTVTSICLSWHQAKDFSACTPTLLFTIKSSRNSIILAFRKIDAFTPHFLLTSPCDYTWLGSLSRNEGFSGCPLWWDSPIRTCVASLRQNWFSRYFAQTKLDTWKTC